MIHFYHNHHRKGEPEQPLFFLLDSASVPLAKGLMEGDLGDPNIRLKIVEGSVEDVVNAQHIQVVSMSNDIPHQLGSVILRRGNHVVLEPLKRLSDEVRRNLRMPTSFTTLVYPVDEADHRRITVLSNDLSCGGISFFSDEEFEVGDILEIFIPITRISPLLLRCQLLRKKPVSDSKTLYASKFVDMINEQESMVREAVFNLQLKKIH